MENDLSHGHTVAGTAGGTLLVLLVKLSFSEMGHTVLLAALGATVSFGVSVLLKRLSKRYSSKQTNTLNNKKQNNGKI